MPAASGSRPSSASSSVVLPLPFGPAIASRSPQPTSRSSGPSRNEPRSTTASSSRTTTSPLRAAGASESWSSHGSYGFSTVSTRASFARVRPLHVLRLLLLAALAVAAALPLGHAALLLLDAPALGDRRLPAAVVTLAPPLALGLVVAPAAAVLRRAARPLVELDDARDGAVEEGAVVRDDDDRAWMRGERALEPGEPGEVEVVRRLVEQEDVEAAAEHGRERRARLLPARAGAGGVPLLREIADRERRRRAPDATGVRLLQSGEQAQQRRLAGAVRADEPDPRARRHDEVDVREDDLGSVRLRDSGRDERAGKARHAQRPPTTWELGQGRMRRVSCA